MVSKSKSALRNEASAAVADHVAKGNKVTILPTSGRKLPDTTATMVAAATARGNNAIEYLDDTHARATFTVTAETQRELPDNQFVNKNGKRVSKPRSHTCTLDFSGLDNKHWMRVAMSNGVIVKVQAILRNQTYAEMDSGIGLGGINLRHFIVRDIIPMERTRTSNFGGGRAPVTEVSRITKLIADSRAAGMAVDARQERSMLAKAAKDDAAKASQAAKVAMQPSAPDTAKPATVKAAKAARSK
jgi:hypothetical protein